MKQIAILLGLAETAAEPEILQAIQDVQLKAQRVDTLEATIQQAADAEIAREVQLAVSSKRITADKTDHFTTLGKTAGIEVLRSTLQMIPTNVKPTDLITGSSSSQTEFAKLSEVPAEKRETLRAEDPEMYAKLYKAEYGIDCKI